MPIETIGESFPEALAIGKGVLFSVQQEIIYGSKTDESESVKFDVAFYYGIVRSIKAAADSSEKTSAKICNVDTVDMKIGKITPCFRNLVMVEGDTNFSIIQVMDNIITERSHLFVPVLSDAVSVNQI